MDSEDTCTVIRVKRKLNEPLAGSRYQTPKRLRHIGSFVEQKDEETLGSSSVFKQTGINKRIKFDDLSLEQFQDFVKDISNCDTTTNQDSSINSGVGGSNQGKIICPF